MAWCNRTLALARETKASFIWCGTLKPAGYGAYYTYARSGIPYGILLYGTELQHLRQQMRARSYKRLLARRLLGSAAVLVTISRWTRTVALEVLAEAGCNPDRADVRAVLLGTEPEHFKPGIDTAGVRAKYGLRDGRWVLTIARLVPHKGQDVVLRALASLAGTDPDLRYMIVGSGPYRAPLEALAATLGIADRVHFLGAVPDADIPALYNVADIYVGPSRNAEGHVEGFGISFVEASACAVPVIAGKSGGAPEAVIEGQTALLVDSDSPASVADAIQRVLRDHDLAERLSAGGRRAVETYFNWDRATREIRAIAEEHARRSVANEQAARYTSSQRG